ncbi:calcium-binding protein [Gloeocapsopsis sp. IPPAS B-1203]|uniref:calcium-binding protein n=1 Tax=Gloeocapsopsis sp. IPPAS B-1203 TaxID=2049454 RepID=UPI000C1743C3|nr:calcium-binding protein [Gloeocapsopsis sp. IPPAS B-1203]PIG91146.1 hypothetical protein CSQ79_23275 [Gloeocapsopsis sp. IPPAS B-1203]
MVTIKGQNGDDLNLRGTEQSDIIYGDPAFGSGTDYIFGLGGDDNISGVGGTDYINGGFGNDTIHGDEGDDNLYGNEDNDTLYGDIGSDHLFGGSGDDELRGGYGDDFVYGGDGNDVIYEYDGANTLEGNGGRDVFYLNNLVNQPPNAALVKGGTENDSVYAYSGSYTIYGEEGNDYIQLGNPTVPLTNPIDLSAAAFGGRDNDTYAVGQGVSSEYVSIVESPNEGFDKVVSYVSSFTLPDNVEELQVRALADYASPVIRGFGNSQDNVISADIIPTQVKSELHGNGGNDYLYGDQNNNNSLFGESGNDYLFGGGSKDSLNGGSENDLLVGGAGNDTLTGGAGKDRFEFNAPNEGIDIIKDFKAVDDTIEVFGIGFGGGLTAGAITADQFRLGSSAQDASDRFIYNKSNRALFFDIDGKGGAGQIQIATLTGAPSITQSDIVVF